MWRGLLLSVSIFDCPFDFVYFLAFEREILVFLDPQIRQHEIGLEGDLGMFQDGFCAADGASVDRHHLGHVLCRLDESIQVSADSSKTEHLAETLLRKLERRLVGELPDIGGAGAGKDHNIAIRCTVVLRHTFPLS
jgi:hypothetical protein